MKKFNFITGYNDTTNNGSSDHNDSSIEHMIIQDTSVIKTYDKTSSESSSSSSSKRDQHETSRVGLVLGLMLPMCLIMSAIVWTLYAYRNPHTKSGQLLIQVRYKCIVFSNVCTER